MSRPKSISILGKRVRVKFLKEEPLKDTVGLFDPSQMVIYILDTKNWESYLFHEIIHAALYVAGVSTMLEVKEEEAIVTALEHALSGLYKLS